MVWRSQWWVLQVTGEAYGQRRYSSKCMKTTSVCTFGQVNVEIQWLLRKFCLCQGKPARRDATGFLAPTSSCQPIAEQIGVKEIRFRRTASSASGWGGQLGLVAYLASPPNVVRGDAHFT